MLPWVPDLGDLYTRKLGQEGLCLGSGSILREYGVAAIVPGIDNPYGGGRAVIPDTLTRPAAPRS